MKKYVLAILFMLLVAVPLTAKETANARNGVKGIDKFFKHFVWGADIGSSIDLSSNDMSSIDINAYFGYKDKIIRALCVGTSIQSSLGNNHTLIPVYLLFRSSFRARPSLCFLDLRGGYSFNRFRSKYTQSGAFASAGVGFNLFFNSKFNSHIILAYNFFNTEPYGSETECYDIHNLSSVSIRLGISF